MGGKKALMGMRDVSSCSTYNYGDALYWDTRYIQEAGPFDWYQRYSALRPFIHRYIPKSSPILMLGCGNAVMSEDMVKDGYEDIVNIDISSVVIDMMIKKYEHVPQLKYMQMDVRDMSFFFNDSFDSIIDKGTLDSLMCGTNAPISAAQMLGEVSRLLKPGGIYMLITYGDPSVRMPHLNQSKYGWKITLYIIRIRQPYLGLNLWGRMSQWSSLHATHTLAVGKNLVDVPYICAL
ncbi:methyltransferase-like protein 13 isoform X2 [Amborella trichopoda]|uniref:methyltransferase-like protein 13 isoform X2 n=1 Tax=Amborella trichopoda TaxID=13333 RepID=UPI0009BF6C51|nr:methyltransferase-like protein 13 isoform X2 [Amborella trichopoda]|eukprot:XP_020526621.1 methyltransferase-like protein 13 isoform X2 [Amborella trichopoda]